jgi:hypothetical protein
MIFTRRLLRSFSNKARSTPDQGALGVGVGWVVAKLELSKVAVGEVEVDSEVLVIIMSWSAPFINLKLKKIYLPEPIIAKYSFRNCYKIISIPIFK